MKVIRHRKPLKIKRADVYLLSCDPEGIQTPNLLIRSQNIEPLYETNCVRITGSLEFLRKDLVPFQQETPTFRGFFKRKM